MENYIAYYRVSTKKQFLGLEAQERDITNYISRKAGMLLASYTEKESGTRKGKRIEIYKAIQQCKQTGAVLLIAKLDRLARDVEFVYNLKNSGVKFLAVDMPDANELTVGVMAVMAEAEANMIRTRIVAALNAKKARGEKLGKISNLKKHRNKGLTNSMKVRTELAKINNHQATGVICDLRSAGKTFEQIASRLNELNFTTTRGKAFSASTAYILHDRYCSK